MRSHNRFVVSSYTYFIGKTRKVHKEVTRQINSVCEKTRVHTTFWSTLSSSLAKKMDFDLVGNLCLLFIRLKLKEQSISIVLTYGLKE